MGGEWGREKETDERGGGGIGGRLRPAGRHGTGGGIQCISHVAYYKYYLNIYIIYYVHNITWRGKYRLLVAVLGIALYYISLDYILYILYYLLIYIILHQVGR